MVNSAQVSEASIWTRIGLGPTWCCSVPTLPRRSRPMLLLMMPCAPLFASHEGRPLSQGGQPGACQPADGSAAGCRQVRRSAFSRGAVRAGSTRLRRPRPFSPEAPRPLTNRSQQRQPPRLTMSSPPRPPRPARTWTLVPGTSRTQSASICNLKWPSTLADPPASGIARSVTRGSPKHAAATQRLVRSNRDSRHCLGEAP